MMRRDPPPSRPTYVLPEHSKPKLTPSRPSSSPRKRKLRKKSGKHQRQSAAAGEDPAKAIATYSQLYKTLADGDSGDEGFPARDPPPSTRHPSAPSSPTTHDTLSALSKLIKKEIKDWSSEVDGFSPPPDSAGARGAEGGEGGSDEKSYIRRMHNLHLSDEEYSTRFGVKALMKEFGEVQVFTPTAVVIMDKQNSERLVGVEGVGV